MQPAAFLSALSALSAGEYSHESTQSICKQETTVSPADSADLRRQTTKQPLPQTNCLSLRNNAACCVPLRHLRYLRENIHIRVLNLSAQMKPQMSPADLADLRRQNPKLH